MTPLSPKRRSELRAEAHRLSPVVIIGDKGLTDEVIAEIDRSLKAHELIKVRAATDERDARAVWIETICDRLQAHPVQQIGKVFVIYRENEAEAQGTRRKAQETEKAQGTRRKAQETEKAQEAPGTRRKARDTEKAQGTRRKARDTEKAQGTRRKAQEEAGEQQGRGAGRSRALRLAPDAPSTTRTSRQRSPAPSPRPASEPRRRRPRTSR
ncbi:MAG TPA: ribosome assembly RNA-binding protein YhbY [Usitatibacter sp.]|nr:ribosome assembly RNA-binding protein YhbY [Usitatibacter sp.]